MQDLGFEVALIRAEAGNEALSPRCPGTRDPGIGRGARGFFSNYANARRTRARNAKISPAGERGVTMSAEPRRYAKKNDSETPPQAIPKRVG